MNAIQLAAKLYDARDTAKRLLGERQYQEKLEQAKQITQSKAEREKTTQTSAATSLAKEAQNDGQSVIALLFLCVFVELSETNHPPKANT